MSDPLAKETSVRTIATSLIGEWKEALPEFPWDTATELIVAAVLHHEDLLLLTNEQASRLMEEHGIPLPVGFLASDIAGRANPGIVRVRTELQRRG